jgi:hypothetical protein
MADAFAIRSEATSRYCLREMNSYVLRRSTMAMPDSQSSSAKKNGGPGAAVLVSVDTRRGLLAVALAVSFVFPVAFVFAVALALILATGRTVTLAAMVAARFRVAGAHRAV